MYSREHVKSRNVAHFLRQLSCSFISRIKPVGFLAYGNESLLERLQKNGGKKKKNQIFMCCMEDEGAKKGNELHSSNYIKLLIFCSFIAHKLLSNIQTSELKNTACPGILLLENSDLKNEICFARFILFTALIITQIKHVLQRVIGATDLRHTKDCFSCSEILTPQSCRVILLSQRFQKPDLQLPKKSPGLQFTHKDCTQHSYQDTVLQAGVYSTTLFQSEVNKQVLIYLYLSPVCINQTEPTCTFLLKNYMAQSKTLLSRQRIIPTDIKYN